MPYPSRRLSPTADAVGSPTLARPSLFEHKDAFIDRMAPVSLAAVYFGSFSLAPQDAALSRQALFKLSFLHRYFLYPAGLRVVVKNQTAQLSGQVTGRHIGLAGEILARQICGIEEIDNLTDPGHDVPAALSRRGAAELARESAELLLATDQTLTSPLHVALEKSRIAVSGNVSSPAQRQWVEQIVRWVSPDFDSQLQVELPPAAQGRPPEVDDESLQALVLLRLKLVPDTAGLTMKVKAHRGVLTLTGKVRTEALRQQVENLTRSTLGLRELRSSLTLAG